jgi:hypothetical protein
MIQNITEVRKAIVAKLEDLPESFEVKMGPSEYGQGPKFDELKLILRTRVGDACEETEERIDQLFYEVPDRLADDPTLGDLVSDAIIVRCGGHQLFKSDNGEVSLGTDWTVRVRAD